MSLNSSSSTDILSEYLEDFMIDMRCFVSRAGSSSFTVFLVLNILLLLPLCIFILHHGVQRWRKKSSTSSPMSHSDSFTYHMVSMEMIAIVGSVLIFVSIFRRHLKTFVVGYNLFNCPWYGQMFFHVLTCVERYLAVVHPITYLSLRQQRGIRMRNISITCVWLLSFALTGWMMFDDFAVADFLSMILSLIVTSFCSVSVLCVLIRPGPGEQGGARERVDQSKQRAFYTIMVILGVLVLRFAGSLAETVMYWHKDNPDCRGLMVEIWSNFPSSLVLPLMFMHRAGKLGCCKKNV